MSSTAERTRRRFARRQRARRWRVWRLVVAVVVVLALVVTGIWLVFFSDHLAVEGVDVRGADQLEPARIEQAAAVPEGEPLARVDLFRIEARVRSLAMVRSATVSREWPDSVRIEVEERRAIAVLEIGGRLRGMDAEGVVFREFEERPGHLPRVTTGSDTRGEALAEVAGVISALPDGVARRVDHVEVATIDQIQLVLRDGRRVEWGSAEQSEEKARVLPVLLQQDGQVFDVSVPGTPTAR